VIPLLVVLVLAVLPSFRSPTGNIRCEASTKLLVCSIEQSAYARRLQYGCINPKGEMGAGIDWHGFELTRTGKASVLCTGGAMFPGTPPRFPKLPYGVPWKGGPFSCVVKPSGVTCVNGRNHGFFISRASYRLF
jgi:hypothetical protein